MDGIKGFVALETKGEETQWVSLEQPPSSAVPRMTVDVPKGQANGETR